jgi:GTPase
VVRRQAQEPTTFIIDETFGVPGVGTVVAGTLKGGVITTGASLLLGPDLADGSFKPTAIKSIAYKRLTVHKARGCSARRASHASRLRYPCAWHV